MEENVVTKKCKKCGMELPISEFYRNRREFDGHSPYCKVCHKESMEKSRHKKKDSSHSMNKIFLNPDLAKFQPRELIAELRARGYSGELSYKQVIIV
jgi:hypothetical protein